MCWILNYIECAKYVNSKMNSISKSATTTTNERTNMELNSVSFVFLLFCVYPHKFIFSLCHRMSAIHTNTLTISKIDGDIQMECNCLVFGQRVNENKKKFSYFIETMEHWKHPQWTNFDCDKQTNRKNNKKNGIPLNWKTKKKTIYGQCEQMFVVIESESNPKYRYVSL